MPETVLGGAEMRREKGTRPQLDDEDLKSEIAHRRSLFEQKVSVSESFGCWQWHGASTREGSTSFGLGRLGGVRTAYVSAWVLYRDPGYDVTSRRVFHHLCGNTLCVNPRHFAIVGRDGLFNPDEVCLYLADQHPAARSELVKAHRQLRARQG